MNYKIIIPALFLFSMFISSCGGSEKPAPEAKAIINITSLVGKTLAETEGILGKTDTVEKVFLGEKVGKDSCDKGFFQSGKYDIVFIDGKADWIAINGMSDYDLNNDAITLLGLPKSNPSFSNPKFVLRWENVEGINEISFFNNGSNKINYIYVKAYTK